MGHIMNEKLNCIGMINDDGYLFDNAGNCFAHITEDGYIAQVAGWDVYGKIDKDGTIRDSSMEVVGRIQADGYVYIHSCRICMVSSGFIERITPFAWNAGLLTNYNGGKTVSPEDLNQDSGHLDFLFSPFFLKLISGIALGIYVMANNYGGLEMLLAGPIFVFLIFLIFKIFTFFK